MPARRPRRRALLTREARRQQILDAALTAFEKGGYHGTHVEAVIREAGIARGTFYLHFESKHAVFAALVDRMLDLFLAARPTEPDPDVRTVADAETLLRRSYHAVFEAFRQHRRLGRLLFEEAVGLDKGFADRIARHFRVWHERVAATLLHLQERGVARADLDAAVTADFLLGAVERVARQHLFVEAEPDIPHLVDAIVALELRGIGA